MEDGGKYTIEQLRKAFGAGAHSVENEKYDLGRRLAKLEGEVNLLKYYRDHKKRLSLVDEAFIRYGIPLKEEAF